MRSFLNGRRTNLPESLRRPSPPRPNAAPPEHVVAQTGVDVGKKARGTDVKARLTRALRGKSIVGGREITVNSQRTGSCDPEPKGGIQDIRQVLFAFLLPVPCNGLPVKKQE